MSPGRVRLLSFPEFRAGRLAGWPAGAPSWASARPWAPIGPYFGRVHLAPNERFGARAGLRLEAREAHWEECCGPASSRLLEAGATERRLKASPGPPGPSTMDIWTTVWTWIYGYWRPILKGFLRLATRLCELQRVCYGQARGAPRTGAVEMALGQSRDAVVARVLVALDRQLALGAFVGDRRERLVLTAAVEDIMGTKRIKRQLHPQFEVSLRQCLRQIWGYRQLVHQVERLRTESYNPAESGHEQDLLELWRLLQPGIPLTHRRTKQWQIIGFQGEDPATDFRGMGRLGLANLLYFAQAHTSTAQHILSHSHHPQHGFYTTLHPITPHVRYSFAIVGINLTDMAFRLLTEGCAKNHFFNVTDAKPTLTHFHYFYAFLFVEFDKFWLSERPRDIMEFNRIRDLFENNIRTQLADTTTCLKINVVVESV
eukprot:maker-scaffold697_size109876-snap-gene-0.20 protein:Tk05842 transcript:maker-scaffold697_size109876-snap-gene-0.20-mRNA-1 annotation:"elmo domain-containing protein 1"